MGKRTEAWAVRFWRWNSEAARSDENGDLASQQHEVFQEYPSRAMALAAGPGLVAAERLATSPGLFDLMRGTPDRFSPDGWQWDVAEEIRP